MRRRAAPSPPSRAPRRGDGVVERPVEEKRPARVPTRDTSPRPAPATSLPRSRRGGTGAMNRASDPRRSPGTTAGPYGAGRGRSSSRAGQQAMASLRPPHASRASRSSTATALWIEAISGADSVAIAAGSVVRVQPASTRLRQDPHSHVLDLKLGVAQPRPRSPPPPRPARRRRHFATSRVSNHSDRPSTPAPCPAARVVVDDQAVQEEARGRV